MIPLAAHEHMPRHRHFDTGSRPYNSLSGTVVKVASLTAASATKPCRICACGTNPELDLLNHLYGIVRAGHYDATLSSVLFNRQQRSAAINRRGGISECSLCCEGRSRSLRICIKEIQREHLSFAARSFLTRK